MQTADFWVIGAYVALVLTIGILWSRRGGASTEEYFLSGRRLPWWLAGVSMVATTFAADTPLAVTGIVAKQGIAGNWVWWSMAFSALLTTFFYARLWRLSGVATDAEFAVLRYGGRPAQFLRVFRALYLAIPVNILIMGWVTLGMTKVIQAAFGWDIWLTIALLYGLTLAYMAISGLWGVVLADFVQFTLAMAGSVILAVTAVDRVGGLQALREKLLIAGHPPELLSFFPQTGSELFTLFLVYVGVQWWATSYPGAEPGGGGYVAQRLLSVKDENHAFGASLLFNIAHYALRPWPWIITGLCALVLLPGLSDPELGYPLLMKQLMPPGLLGLMAVVFLAAFMSTISTHLNWGASYIVQDVFGRRLASAPESHKVFVSRVTVVLLGFMAVAISLVFDNVKQVWEFLLMFGAGAGPVHLLRWFWWRINAYSEIAALAGSAVVALAVRLSGIESFATGMLLTAGCTTAIWLLFTFLTKPEDDGTLRAFYNKIRPGGFWGRYIPPEIKNEKKRGYTLLGLYWLASCFLLYAVMYLTKWLLLGS